MPLLIFVAFVFVWYFPVWRKQGKLGRLPKWTIAKSIGIGMVPVFLAIILIQIGLNFIRRAFAPSSVADAAFEAYISAAVVEEGIKFLAAYLIVRKLQPKRKVDYVLIFGAIGLGYEITETVIQLNDALAGIIRGVFAFHIIWQFWMGMFYFEYRQAKANNNTRARRRNLILAFAVPLFLHGTNDFLLFMAEKQLSGPAAAMLESFQMTDTLTPELETLALWILVLLVFLIAELVFQIITYKMALKTAKESRMADESAIPETAAESDEQLRAGETSDSLDAKQE